MKSKILFSFLGVLVVIAMIALWSIGVNAIKQLENDSVLTLKVSSDKQIYVPGEPVKLNFEVSNETDKALSLPYRPDVSTGYLGVWIAFSADRFNRYNNTSWGRMEDGGPTLQPGQSFKSQAVVLFNSKPDISRLNVEAIKNSPEGAVLSDYAFPEAGVYSIKAVLSFSSINLKVESEPIQIVVSEPVGDDLKVWNQIKDSGEIASFIETGSFLTSKNEEEEKLIEKVKQLTQTYPNSFLAGQLKQKLEKFKTGEQRRKETLEKFRVNTKN